MNADAPTRYRFARADGEVWLGLRPLPLATLAAALSGAVLALYIGAPLPVGAVVLLAGALAGLVPLAGRPAVEWAPAATRHLGAAAAGRRAWTAHLHIPRATAAGPVTLLRLPGEYGRLRLVDLDGIGLLDDPAGRVLTGVLAVAGSDRFPMLEPAEQSRLLAGWGAALAGLAADTRIRRVQWIERAGPEDRDPAAWLAARTGTTEDLEDYRALAASATATGFRHDVWLAIALGAPRGRRADTAATALAGLRDVARVLLGAELVGRPLAAGEIGGLLRRFTDPAGALAETATGAGAVGPVSRRIGWDAVRTDDSWHRSFAVTGWPRLPVASGWLEPLLLAAPTGAVRTVSVHLHPVPVALAARQARAARSRARLDLADRTRLGLVESASTDAAAQDAVSAEEELVAGYRLHRIAAVITVSAGSPTGLDEACRAVWTAATTARLDLRPLHGQHQAGFVATLPLCRAGGRSR